MAFGWGGSGAHVPPDGSITTVKLADGVATPVKIAAAVEHRAGSDTSTGTEGTVVGEIEASAGNKLVAWMVFGKQSSGSSSFMTLTVTYTDSTTDTFATQPSTQMAFMASPDGAMSTAGNNASERWDDTTGKAVKKISVTTNGTLAITRNARLSAFEVQA